MDGKGNFTIENFQNKAVPTKQQIDYICREGRNKYHPTKTYMGFRYVKVEADFEIDPAAFRAVAVYSDIRTTAEFSCGVSEVNQLFQNALWSMKGNFIDVPTDCPTREKSGYSARLSGLYPYCNVSDGLLSGGCKMDSRTGSRSI